MTGAEDGRIAAPDGTSLYYERLGASNPMAAILIVHGIDDHQDRYLYLKPALAAAGYTVYSYDQRGHGKSDGARTDVVRFQDYVDDLSIVRDMIREREAENARIFAYGHSMGAVVTLLHALDHPQEWASVITGGCAVLPVSFPWLWLRPSVNVLSWLIPKLRLSSNIRGVDLTHDHAVALAYERDPMVNHSITLRWAAQFLNGAEALRNHAASLKVPVLLLHGEADRVARVEGSRWMHEQIGCPEKQLLTYPGLFHELHNERKVDAERVFADVLQWLARMAPA